MHTSLLISTTLSLLSVLATAVPTPLASVSVVSASTPMPSTAHLPGTPHAPNLHPLQSSQGSQSSQDSQPSQGSQSSQRSQVTNLQNRNLGLEQMRELMVEIKRSAGGNSGGKGKDGSEENHATYMLGSPVSFPARGGIGGRNVA